MANSADELDGTLLLADEGTSSFSFFNKASLFNGLKEDEEGEEDGAMGWGAQGMYSQSSSSEARGDLRQSFCPSSKPKAKPAMPAKLPQQRN